VKRLNIAVAVVFGWACTAWAVPPTPLTALRDIRALSNAEASRALPVSFQATVNYFRAYDGAMYVQDGDVAIFVKSTIATKLIPGDRILIKGITYASFRPNVLSSEITFLHHGSLPKAIPSTLDELIRAEHVCVLVSVHARVRAADLVYTPLYCPRTLGGRSAQHVLLEVFKCEFES